MPETTRSLSVAVIGAGMAGILSAIRLSEAGFEDFVVYEKADRLGGTWRDNTYPGLTCDVPSPLYSYSFAPNPEWSHRYSPGSEIQSYLERVAREHRVERFMRFGDEVVCCTFIEGRWEIETRSGQVDRVDVVIAATGVLHQPRQPEIEGLASFRGAVFHSARWDHGTTLQGARFGLIGNGSTGVQIVSAVVDQVARLSLFQRTAQWIMPMENPACTEAEQAAVRQDPTVATAQHRSLAELFSVFSDSIVDADSPRMKWVEQTCLDNLENNVRDPALRDRLRPTYRAGCKRLVISADFYAAIQRPNAELVSEAITRIEPEGIRTADGRLHPLDVLVLATGFKADAFMRPMQISGRAGRPLSDAWKQRPSAYLSVSIPDFPNLFMLNGPNGPVGNFSLIEVAELQFGYILQLVERLRSGAGREICASAEAMASFEAARTEAARKTIWMTGCRSWYLDDRGVPASWPWPFSRFVEEMREPRWEAFELR